MTNDGTGFKGARSIATWIDETHYSDGTAEDDDTQWECVPWECSWCDAEVCCEDDNDE